MKRNWDGTFSIHKVLWGPKETIKALKGSSDICKLYKKNESTLMFDDLKKNVGDVPAFFEEGKENKREVPDTCWECLWCLQLKTRLDFAWFQKKEDPANKDKQKGHYVSWADPMKFLYMDYYVREHILEIEKPVEKPVE